MTIFQSGTKRPSKLSHSWNWNWSNQWNTFLFGPRVLNRCQWQNPTKILIRFDKLEQHWNSNLNFQFWDRSQNWLWLFRSILFKFESDFLSWNGQLNFRVFYLETQLLTTELPVSDRSPWSNQMMMMVMLSQLFFP